MAKTEWPAWWNWELELTPHLFKRMLDRGFTEVDLRGMLERATGHHADICDGRFIVETRHAGKPWQVIVEPDEEDFLLVIVTAYPVETR
jgi:hypothetical protein